MPFTLLLLALTQAPPLTLAPCGSFDVTGGDVQGVDFDRDARRMLTSGFLGDAVLWDLDTLAVVGGIGFRDNVIVALALHPEGTLAALSVATRLELGAPELRVVDLRRGRVLDRRAVGGELAWSVTGDTLAVRVAGVVTVRRWLHDDGKLGAPEEQSGVRPSAERWRSCRGALNDEGRARIDALGGAVAVVADRSGRLQVSRGSEEREVSGHVGPVIEIAFTDDGNYLGARSSGATTLATSGGRILRRIVGAASVATGSAGAELWVIGSHDATRWDVADQREVHRPTAGVRDRWRVESGVTRLFLSGARRSPFGRSSVALGNAIAASNHQRRTTLWAEGDDPRPLPTTHAIRDLIYQRFVRSRDAKRWAVLHSPHKGDCLTCFPPSETPGAVHAYTDAGAGLFAARLDAAPSAAAFSPDGQELLVGLNAEFLMPLTTDRRPHGPSLELRDVTSGAVRVQVPCATAPDWLGYIDADTVLALLGTTLEVLDAKTLRPRQAIDLGPRPCCAADLSADGSRLALGRGHRVELYEIRR